MRRIELTGLFAGIRCKVADQVLIDKAQNIIILLAIHGNILNEVNQIPDSLCACTGTFTQLGQTGLQRCKNAIKHLLVMGVDQAAECLKCHRHIVRFEVAAFADPCRKQIVVCDKIADVAPYTVDRFSIFFGQIRQILVRPVVFFQILDFLVRQKFIKHEAQNVILVLIGFDFGAHLVGGLPNLRCELLLVHALPPNRVRLSARYADVQKIGRLCRSVSVLLSQLYKTFARFAI